MLSHIKSRSIMNSVRHLCTTPQLSFKFKLTEEMSKEFEEKQKSEKKTTPQQAIHTRENPLIMGRVSHDRYEKVIKVAIPKHRLNEFLLLYVRENDNVQALDENGISSPGDWVLLRRDNDIVDKNVTHKVERVVYSYGKYIDPLTGRRSLGVYYDDDVERLERIKLDL